MLFIYSGIPNVVYLTKLDKVCPLVDEDVRRVYHSQACKQALETAADVIGVPRGHVFPVKNYEKESQLQTNISILALTAIRQTLVFADDYLEDKYELSQSHQMHDQNHFKYKMAFANTGLMYILFYYYLMLVLIISKVLRFSVST